MILLFKRPEFFLPPPFFTADRFEGYCFGLFNQRTIVAADKPNYGDTDPEQSSIYKALELVRGKWRLAIILRLGTDTLRYGELRSRLPAVSEKVLAGELKALSRLGVLSRKAYPEVPPRVEYTLTERGRQALPLFASLTEIGRLFS